jgi:hypothetical protein
MRRSRSHARFCSFEGVLDRRKEERVDFDGRLTSCTNAATFLPFSALSAFSDAPFTDATLTDATLTALGCTHFNLPLICQGNKFGP